MTETEALLWALKRTKWEKDVIGVGVIGVMEEDEKT